MCCSAYQAHKAPPVERDAFSGSLVEACLRAQGLLSGSVFPAGHVFGRPALAGCLASHRQAVEGRVVSDGCRYRRIRRAESAGQGRSVRVGVGGAATVGVFRGSSRVFFNTGSEQTAARGPPQAQTHQAPASGSTPAPRPPEDPRPPAITKTKQPREQQEPQQAATAWSDLSSFLQEGLAPSDLPFFFKGRCAGKIEYAPGENRIHRAVPPPASAGNTALALRMGARGVKPLASCSCAPFPSA